MGVSVVKILAALSGGLTSSLVPAVANAAVLEPTAAFFKIAGAVLEPASHAVAAEAEEDAASQVESAVRHIPTPGLLSVVYVGGYSSYSESYHFFLRAITRKVQVRGLGPIRQYIKKGPGFGLGLAAALLHRRAVAALRRRALAVRSSGARCHDRSR